MAENEAHRPGLVNHPAAKNTLRVRYCLEQVSKTSFFGALARLEARPAKNAPVGPSIQAGKQSFS
jgi:hypothetical protein